MADEVDQAQDQIEAVVRSALYAARRPSKIHPIGECHYCGAPLLPRQLFCDAVCRDMYEDEERLKRLSGIR